jgi:hypothetical protein
MRMCRLEFPLAKAEYLLNYSVESGEEGDKRKFWWHIMGFRSPEALRAALLAGVSIALLQFQGQDRYGERYKAVASITGPSGLSQQIRTVWVVRPGEDVARFVTAFPERSR